jgi:fructokinase
VPVIDTVGAGDAFSSVLLTGLAHQWQPAETMRRASSLAAAICGMRGACPDHPDFYRTWRAQWLDAEVST